MLEFILNDDEYQNLLNKQNLEKMEFKALFILGVLSLLASILKSQNYFYFLASIGILVSSIIFLFLNKKEEKLTKSKIDNRVQKLIFLYYKIHKNELSLTRIPTTQFCCKEGNEILLDDKKSIKIENICFLTNEELNSDELFVAKKELTLNKNIDTILNEVEIIILSSNKYLEVLAYGKI